MKTLPEQPTALKPCPFCGSAPRTNLAKKTYCSLHGEPSQRVLLYCDSDKCPAKPGVNGGDVYNDGYEDAKDKAVEKWNTRADAAPDTSAEPVAWIIGENPNAWATLRRDLLSSVKPGTKVTPLYMHPAPSPDGLDIDALAQVIRRIDGNHDLGAGALAEALMPFLKSWLGVG